MHSAISRLASERECECSTALASALLTPRNRMREQARDRLGPILARYLAGIGQDTLAAIPESGEGMPTTDNDNDILVVGSIGFDDIETPFGKADHVLGGSTVYFAPAAASLWPRLTSCRWSELTCRSNPSTSCVSETWISKVCRSRRARPFTGLANTAST